MNTSLCLLPDIFDGEDKTSPFKNCIRNNYRHIRKWAKRTHTNCFRIYDHDIPNYPLAIDFYAGRFCVHYFPNMFEDEEPSKALENETAKILNDLFKASPELIFWRTRIKRAKMQQYEKADDTKDFFNVIEYGVHFKINLTDYLDTGLFLDHRETRQMVAKLASGKRLLNLFAYTCSFSIHAACKGASFTKSVDMSNTYTTWGKENFLLNTQSLEQNEIVRADCFVFLEEEAAKKQTYDLIVLDPPTISRSKKMQEMFDIQQDYQELISATLKLLSKDGILFFSTNSRKFRFDDSLFSGFVCQDISASTIPLDFHNQKIHRCWKIQHSPSIHH